MASILLPLLLFTSFSFNPINCISNVQSSRISFSPSDAFNVRSSFDTFQADAGLGVHGLSIVTVLQSVEIEDATDLKIKWRLEINGRQLNPGRNDANHDMRNISVDWMIGVREFGTNIIKETKVNEKISLINERFLIDKNNYTLKIEDLKPSTGYEICFQESNIRTPIIDNDLIYRRNNYLLERRHPNCERFKINVICKEVVTKSHESSVNSVALASAVSSASTFVVLVLFCCCCYPVLKKEDAETSDRSFIKIRGVKGFKKDKNPENLKQNSENLTENPENLNIQNISGIDHAYQAVSSNDDNEEDAKLDYYLDPKDILGIKKGNETLIFVKVEKEDAKNDDYINYPSFESQNMDAKGTPV